MGVLLMKFKDGMHAITRTGRYFAVVLGLAGLALAACGGQESDDAKVLNTIANAMKAQGHPGEAAIAQADGASLTPIPAGLDRKWHIYDVDATLSDPAGFSAGVGPNQVVLLTDNGPAFSLFAQAAGVRITDGGRAATFARAYLRATRRTDVLGYTVDNVGQIGFRPKLTGADAARRDAIVRKYRNVITAPRAEKDTGGFTVTAYFVRDRSLQRRTLEIGQTGVVKDHAKTLEDDMPLPYTL